MCTLGRGSRDPVDPEFTFMLTQSSVHLYPAFDSEFETSRGVGARELADFDSFLRGSGRDSLLHVNM